MTQPGPVPSHSAGRQALAAEAASQSAAPGSAAALAPADRPSIEATTPSLGLRLWLEGGQVCLQVATRGGRGAADGLLLLPVHRGTGGHWQLCPAWWNGGAPAPGWWTPRWRKLRQTSAAPATLRLLPARWHQLAEPAADGWLLCLLLYRRRQPPQAAGAAVHFAHPGREPQAVLQAIAQAVQAGPAAAWWRRGLVRVPADDMAALQAERAAMLAPARSWTLAASSCQYPPGVFDCTPPGAQDGQRPPGPADAAMLRLARRLDRAEAGAAAAAEPVPSLLLLCGDQIYADATAGLADPRLGVLPAQRGDARDAPGWLRRPYRHWLEQAGNLAVLGRLPSRALLDDHEIEDNWAPQAPGGDPLDALACQQAERRRQAGVAAHQRYLRNRPGGTDLPVLWQALQHRGLPIFVMDTRSERSHRSAAQPAEQACLLGQPQWQAFLAWLQALPTDRPACVVSSALLLPRRRASARHGASALHSDAWCGFPGSLHRLLAAVWASGRHDLVFVSGDEHLSGMAWATVSDGRRTVRLHSVHASGLYTPFPFANSRADDFANADAWSFEVAGPLDGVRRHLHCRVGLVADWLPGDGVGLITLQPPAAQAGGPWQLQVHFERARGLHALPVVPLGPPPEAAAG